MVAGLIDKDEQPEEVAHREGEEEAGLTFSALWPITQYFPSPGGSTEFVHLYLGVATAPASAACMAGGRSRRHPRLGLGVRRCPAGGARRRICNAASIIACNGWR
jgi:ADP-ribose pyrophosphatase